MEYLDDPGLCAKIFLVCTQFQKGFGTALMEQSVKELLITVDQGIEFMGESKHHVEVRGINDFLFFVKCFSLKKASEFPFFSMGFSLLSAGIMHPCA